MVPFSCCDEFLRSAATFKGRPMGCASPTRYALTGLTENSAAHK